MILTSHQPNFLPYMGFFYKVAKSDVFVISDDVIYSKSAMNNWNYIYGQKGKEKITLPVHAHHDTRLCDIKICDKESSLKKICRRLEENYSHSLHYEDGMEIVKFMKHSDEDNMVDFNLSLIVFLLYKLGIKTKIYIATKNLNLEGHKDERIFKMFEGIEADVYLSGTGAKVYHKDEEYEKRGIKLVYSDYEPIVYKQKHGDFIPNLSVIDYVFNCGFELPQGWVKK